MANAELNVQLKLTLLEAEVQRVAAQLNKSISGSIDKKTASKSNDTQKEYQRTDYQRQKDLDRAFKAMDKMKQRATAFNREMSSLMMPLFHPTSMWANFVASRQVYMAMSSRFGQQARDSKMGGIGAGAATAAIMTSTLAVAFSLTALKKVVSETAGSFERARNIYSRSMQSGLGAGMTTKMGILADIIGVSEKDVLKYGAAISYLNPKIRDTSKILADTSTPLTQVNWEFKVLKLELSAAFAKLAMEARPAILNFIKDLEKLVKSINKNAKFLYDPTGIKKEQNKYRQAADAATAETGGAGMPFTEKRKKWNTALEKYLKNGVPEDNSMPQPQSFMKQLPTSAWEKMGLVIGGKGSTTNDLIRQSNKHLSVIANAITGGAGVPRSFGMNPTIALP